MKNIDSLKYHYQKLIFEDLPEDVRYNISIAGGSVRDYLAGDKVKDIDIFVSSKEVEDKLIAFLKEKGTLMNENDHLGNYKYKDRWVQVIRNKIFPMSAELILGFDFTICQAMLVCRKLTNLDTNEETDTIDLITGNDFFQDLLAKHLRIGTIQFPLSTLERLQKYIKKGYTACNGTLLEISKAIKTVDLDNPDENTLQFYPSGGARFFGID